MLTLTLPSLLPLWISLLTIPVTYLIYKLFIYPHLSSLRHVPGPPRDHLIFGLIGRVLREQPGVLHIKWAEKFGGVVRYIGILGEERLVISDPVALNYILTHAYDFPKPSEIRGRLAQLLGKGMLFAENEDHKRQRKIMNPAFSPAALRDQAPVFVECAQRLRDKWNELIEAGTTDPSCFKDEATSAAYQASKSEDEIVLDVSRWYSKVTLDVIGEAGFGYHFGAVEGKTTKLAEAFGRVFATNAKKGGRTPLHFMLNRALGNLIIALPFDVSNIVPVKAIRRVKEALETMNEVNAEILEAKKQEILTEGEDSLAKGKDIMTLLLRSNMSNTSWEALSDEELQGQMTTMLIAGHETSATVLTWLTWRLSSRPGVQDRLRAEMRAARRAALHQGLDEIPTEELEKLPYLDAVVREVLRLDSPAPATVRTSTQDTVVPLGVPNKSTTGAMMTSLVVPKDTPLFLSIAAVNQSKATWGEDAGNFRPERWLKGEIEGGVGVYSHMLTFLAGPRACIGYKFAVLEIKTILATLIHDFHFSERTPGLDVERRSSLVTRPLIVAEEELGLRMPVKVALARTEE